MSQVLGHVLTKIKIKIKMFKNHFGITVILKAENCLEK